MRWVTCYGRLDTPCSTWERLTRIHRTIPILQSSLERLCSKEKANAASCLRQHLRPRRCRKSGCRVRAAVCHDTYSAHQGVEHDDMNVLVLGARIIGTELARELVKSFLGATFSNEQRHVRRLAKVK